MKKTLATLAAAAFLLTGCIPDAVSNINNQQADNKQATNKQADFAEFLSLLDFKNRLTKAEKESLMEDSLFIHDNPRKFAEKFVANNERLEEEAASEFESYPKWLLYYFSLAQFDNIHIYNDDWKFDNEGLSEFISEETGLEFAYTDDDIRIEAVAEKLEQQSDYSLINLDGGGDDCHFLVIKKADKERILILAQALGIPIS